jgi:hypothetical protein
MASCGNERACPLSEATAASAAWAMVGIRACSRPAREAGTVPLAQNGGKSRLRLRSVDIARCSSFMPLMPSIRLWCILMNIANRLPSSPSIRVHSHGGRIRSSGVLCRRPTSSPSSRSPPGQGSAAWRTWYSRSMSSSSIHTGAGFLLNAYFSRRFHGGVKVRWLRNSAIIWRMKSRGASSGRRNCNRPPT